VIGHPPYPTEDTVTKAMHATMELINSFENNYFNFSHFDEIRSEYQSMDLTLYNHELFKDFTHRAIRRLQDADGMMINFDQNANFINNIKDIDWEYEETGMSQSFFNDFQRTRNMGEFMFMGSFFASYDLEIIGQAMGSSTHFRRTLKGNLAHIGIIRDNGIPFLQMIYENTYMMYILEVICNINSLMIVH